MNNPELLRLKLDCGEAVTFQEPKDNQFVTIGGAGKDKWGDYRHSGYFNTIEKNKQYIGSNSGYPQEELRELLKTWKYIDSYVHAYGDIVPTGTKVLIKENAKELWEKYDLEWDEEREEMVGKVCEVYRSVGVGYNIYNKDRGSLRTFPREAFVIAWEEETDIIDNIFSKLSKEEKEYLISKLK